MEFQLRLALRNMRHLYEQMVRLNGVTNTREAAVELLAPAISKVEEVADLLMKATPKCGL